VAYIIFSLLFRLTAIVLGSACTAWSAWQAWHHTPGDFTAPLAAVGAAACFVFLERAASARKWGHVLVMGVLGFLGAGISGSAVLARNASAQAERVQAAQSANLPKAEARKALAEAQKSLEKAEAEARDECRSGRKLRCEATESRERAARQRVAEARSQVAGLGADSSENPVTQVLGGWAGFYQQGMAVAPALWLELAAPALLAVGFAPWPKRPVVEKPKRKRRKVKRAPRSPALPEQTARSQRARLKLVK
jgi:hypothetical protein